MKVAIVAPLYKEKNAKDFLQEVKEKINPHIIICPCDDKKSAQAVKDEAIVPFHRKKYGYGKSLIEGMCLAWYTYDCDIIITMDADHPVDFIPKFLQQIADPVTEIVVGKETDKWNFSRKLANLIVHSLLKIREVDHPTCGFIAWKKEALKRLPWRFIKANDDGIHVELMFWATRRKLSITQLPFSGHKGGMRSYGLGRTIRWGRTILRLMRTKYLFGWRDLYA